MTMARIKDYHESEAKRHDQTYTWAWEVTIVKYNDYTDELEENIVARFFDPWKAIKFSTKHYLSATVQAVLLVTEYLTDENGVK